MGWDIATIGLWMLMFEMFVQAWRTPKFIQDEFGNWVEETKKQDENRKHHFRCGTDRSGLCDLEVAK